MITRFDMPFYLKDMKQNKLGFNVSVLIMSL